MDFQHLRPIVSGLVGGAHRGRARDVVATALPLLTGRSVRQAFTAFAESEQVPPVLIYAILGLGVLLFVWTLASLVV